MHHAKLRQATLLQSSMAARRRDVRHAPKSGESWTVETSAEYRARHTFRLLQLLSTDRRASAEARRQGIFSSRGLVAAAAKPPGGAEARLSGAAPARKQNSRQRRSAERSCKHHARKAGAVPRPAATAAAPAAHATASPPSNSCAASGSAAMEVEPRPHSPRLRHAAEQRALLQEASDALAARADRRPHRSGYSDEVPSPSTGSEIGGYSGYSD